MSHVNLINYTADTLVCKSVCEIAHKELEKLDLMIAKFNRDASQLMTGRVKQFGESLIQTRNELHKQIESLIQSANMYAKKVQGLNKITIVEEANKLKAYSSELSTTKINVLEDMIYEMLTQEAINKDKEIRSKAYQVLSINEENLIKINTIKDISLRESVYLEAVKDANQNMSYNQLLKIGSDALLKRNEESLTKNKSNIIDQVKTNLQAAKVDEVTINKIINSGESVQKIQENATEEIISESVRKKSISIIAKNIEERGFVVDSKNIKIDKEKNEVNFVASKPNGQKAEFKIFLDGKFIYKFGGYEGQSCQKDIEPFMNDLEEVYGWKITSQETLWSNPDKEHSVKYQSTNKNKDKN